MSLPRFCLGLPWVAWVLIGVGDRCLGVAWRSALGYGFAMSFVWVCRVWIFAGGFWTVISAGFGFSGREVIIRERREMGENRYSLGIYYFIG